MTGDRANIPGLRDLILHSMMNQGCGEDWSSLLSKGIGLRQTMVYINAIGLGCPTCRNAC
jgi:hypothetical protein